METKMIGNKIAEARKTTNISQAQLAQQLFISAQAVGKWERGESIPDIITINRLAKILGVDLNYFSENFQSDSVGASPGQPEVNMEDVPEDIRMSPPNQPMSTIKGAKKMGWNMSRWNWVDADFSGLKNLHEKFSSSNMQRCLFIGSDLSGLILSNNNVDGCDFSKSNIRNCHIQRSNLAKNLFIDCSLNETKFIMSTIKACDFSRADVTGVRFKLCTFTRNILTNTVWNRTSFLATQIAEIVFDGIMDDCYFENCDFKKVTFQNAILKNTFFKNRNLKGIRFVDCQADRMTYEFLKNGKADLSGITLLKG